MIQLPNAIPAANEYFKIESGAFLVNTGTTGAGGLDLNTNLNAAPGAILSQNTAGANVAIRKGGVAIQTAVTTPTYFFGLSSTILENVTVGAGTPWLGLSTGNSFARYNGILATNNTITANSDFVLQGPALGGSQLPPAPTLFLGSGASSTNIIKIATPNGSVTANIVGSVALDNDNSQYGSAGNTVTFQVTPGAILTAAHANAQGVVAGAAVAPADIVVQNGGFLSNFTGDPAAFNGNVTVLPGGMFHHSLSTLTGTGAIAHSNGSILNLVNSAAVSGATQNLGTVPGTIVFLSGSNYLTGTSTSGVTRFDSRLNDAAVFEVASGAILMTAAATASDSLFTLSASGGIGGVLTNDASSRTISGTTGVIAIGSGGGTFAATTSTTLTVDENFALGGNALTIGSTDSFDGNPKLGTVVLGSPSGTNTSAAGSVVAVTGGTTLQLGASDQIPDASRLTVNAGGTMSLGTFSSTFSDAVESLSGAGTIRNPGPVATLTISPITSDANFSGVLTSSTPANLRLTKTGPGKQTLSGANTYAGVTTISEGILSVGSIGDGGVASSNLGSASSTAANLVFDGGTLQYTGATAGTNRNFMINAGKTATFDIVTNSLTISGGSTATNGGLSKIGAGALILTGSNPHTGVTAIAAGTLQLNRSPANNAALVTDGVAGNTDITINGGTLQIAASEQIGNTAGIVLTSGAFNFSGSGRIETIGTFANNGGTFTTGANTLIGTGNTTTWSGGTNTVSDGGAVQDGHVVITGGTNTIEGGATGGVLQVNAGGVGLEMTGGTLALNSDPAVAGVLLLRSSVTTFASAATSNIGSGLALANKGRIDLDGGTRTFTVANGPASTDLAVGAVIANGGVTKAGPGTMASTGANPYSGATTINEGTLALGGTGSFASSPTIEIASGATLDISGVTAGANHDGTRFALASGQTLQGNGTIVGAMAVSAGATLSPGNSVGTLAVGSLTLTSANSVFELEIDLGMTPAADLLNVTGSIAIAGATLDLSLLNASTFYLPETFLIVANDLADAVAGAFGTVGGLPAGYDAIFNYAFSGVDDLGRLGDGNDIAITIIPEPGTIAWGLAPGLLALGHRGRMRWRARRCASRDNTAN